jgi:predicted metal-dependent phosphoesterase TrpH
MNAAQTQVYRYRSNTKEIAHCRTGISLHSHTMHSREYLGRLPGYIAKFPIGGYILEREIGRAHLYQGRVFDFKKVYWTPPLSPREADALERGQIEKAGLAALVSLTDHDNLEAGKHLQMLAERSRTPISVEWTVPYEKTEFHIGVHNLRASRADAWMNEFAACTKQLRREHVREILASLNEDKGVLLVLNHPYWDAESLGQAAHRETLNWFLKDFLAFLHAIEVNGMRSRRENREALQLGEALNVPVISGGDRHGLEPNAVLNVSRAQSFEEFVAEVRWERRSEILLMPQFFEALPLRMVENAYHALCDAPGEFGRRHWMTRVFVEEGGKAKALSQFTGTRFHKVIDQFRWVMGLVANPVVRPALRLPFVGYEEGGL